MYMYTKFQANLKWVVIFHVEHLWMTQMQISYTKIWYPNLDWQRWRSPLDSSVRGWNFRKEARLALSYLRLLNCCMQLKLEESHDLATCYAFISHWRDLWQLMHSSWKSWTIRFLSQAVELRVEMSITAVLHTVSELPHLKGITRRFSSCVWYLKA